VYLKHINEGGHFGRHLIRGHFWDTKQGLFGKKFL